MPDFSTSFPTQRSRYTVSQLVDRVMSACQLRSSSRTSSGDILYYFLEAQDLIARETHWYRGQQSMSLSGGTMEYNLPLQVLAVEEVTWNGRPLPLATIAQIRDLNPRWRSMGPAEPLVAYVHGFSALGLWPAPSTAAATGTLLVVYTALPPQVSDPQDFPFIPTGGEEALVAYGAWKASLRDGAGEGEKRGPMFLQMWLQQLGRLKSMVEALAEGEVTILGEESEFGGIYGRGWGWNPYQLLGPGS